MDERVDVLLVEDNPNDAELALHAFERHRFANSIHWIQDGAEALEFLFRTDRWAGRTNGNPKLVLLDLKLPLVDGLDVLRQLKAEPATRDIPVVMLTSSREESDLVESYRLGVNSYIVKPVDFDAFVEAVRGLGMYWLLLNALPGAKA